MHIKLDGNIDEEVVFPDISGEDAHLIIDMESIIAINSMGIRNWMNWSKGFENFETINVQNIPRVMVEQINMIHKFLPNNAIIDSFYVPFYSEETDEEKLVLMKRGFDFDDDDVKLPQVEDSDGNQMEPDVFPDRYFAFLKK